MSHSVGRIPHEGLGFHGPGLFGAFASVASASRALGLNADDVVHALGHAGEQAAYDLPQITKDLGRTYHTAKVRFKMWASRVPNHGTLEAIRPLRKPHPIPAGEVKAVGIRLGRGYLQIVGWVYTPTTITSAQLNLFYVTAIMLLENDVFTGQFTEKKIRDPKVLDLIGRISINDASMDGTGHAEGNPVEIELTDGTVLSAWGKVRGHAENPIHREDAVDKFRKVTTGRLSPEKQTEVIALCERLDTLDDTSVLTDALQA